MDMLSPWIWALLQNLRFQLFSTFFYFRFLYENGWWGNVKAFLKERKTELFICWGLWPLLSSLGLNETHIGRRCCTFQSSGSYLIEHREVINLIFAKKYIYFYIFFYVFDWASRCNKPYICKHTVLVLSAENAFWMHRHLFGHAAATASSKTRHNKYFATIMPKNRKSSKLNVNTTIIYRTRTVSH